MASLGLSEGPRALNSAPLPACARPLFAVLCCLKPVTQPYSKGRSKSRVL